MKKCGKCKQLLPISGFSKNSAKWDGLQGRCKVCSITYYENNKQLCIKTKVCKLCNKKFIVSRKHRVYCSSKCSKKANDAVQRQWYVANKTLVLERGKNNPNKSYNYRKYVLKKKYNLTPEQHSKMILKQRGLCVICKKPKKLFVDHSHKTGKVRGLLCPHCNSALGFFDDSVSILKRALRYLENEGISKNTTSG